ncbi:MAG: transcription termination factor NusA [Myxococcota bacterium]
MERESENLGEILERVSKDKGIGKKILVEALEAAMLTAARKVYGMEKDIEAHFNENSGDCEIFEFRTVSDKVENTATEISVEDAARLDEQAQPGDSLGIKLETKDMGRIAAQTAKQVIIQRVREAERENIYNEYADRKGELVTGVVRRFERGNLIVDLGRAEAVLPMREQCPRESYRVNDRIQAFVIDVNKQARGSQIVLSRTSPGLLIKLFEMEVPEIYEGIVKIEAAAREPGARSKVAVSSSDRDVDPVGACVGMKGSRVQAVVQELRGEKVDIVPYDEDPARFVCNALAPAEVSRVLIDDANHGMEIIVPDDQLSLAIGRRGQNVRLASQLSGWKLDIISESKIKEVKDRAFKSLGRLAGVNDIHMQTLYNYGIRCAEDILKADAAFLGNIPGIGPDMVERIKKDSVRVVEEEAKELAALKVEEGLEARRQAKAMFEVSDQRKNFLPEVDRMLRVKGVGPTTLGKLEAADVLSVEELANAPSLDVLAEKTQIAKERLDQLRHAAQVYLAKEAKGAELQPSKDDEGPEEGYAPSELLAPPSPQATA